jgi:aldehyde oxidoreductase
MQPLRWFGAHLRTACTEMVATSPMLRDVHATLTFAVNGKRVTVETPAVERLSRVLRDQLGLTGTKVGCDAGDCGACTVLLDGEPVCSCLVPVAQADGHEITTVEGLAARPPLFDLLQKSFLCHGAAQCGACTPGMLVAATALLEKKHKPSESEAMDAIGGVLCRCTGYRKIVTAILEARASRLEDIFPSAGKAVGARMVRLDGQRKVDGTEIFGADEVPTGALTVRAIRCPHHRARFTFGDLDRFVASYPGIVAVFTAKDVPGVDCYGVIPAFADQPVFAHTEVRFRGEAVAIIVGDKEAVEGLDTNHFPVTWEELPPLTTIDSALAEGAPLIHPHRKNNVLTGGRVVRGDVDKALREADVVVEDEYETGFVEHAYIEPEAGFARRVGDGIEIQACTQSPYMDRADIAKILGIGPEAVRIMPTAVGGGFGAKLDLSVQPFVALAAWQLNRPVRMVYSRFESILSTTKRHPARMRLRAGATRDGKLLALDFSADFNTGAYSSWGPTVAARVPVHASGPYKVPHYHAITRAVHTHLVPAGAFRGFGVPQTAIAQEQVYDELADRLGMDRLEFRILNALDGQTPTVTGQVLGEGVGIRACFEALRPKWISARSEATDFNSTGVGVTRRGVGVAGMWYGCGNTSLPNPSTVRIGLKRNGRIALHQGAVDIGQGSNTIVTQICADAMRVPIERFDLVSGDTAISPDCGKTSASRQTFVTGKAAALAGLKLRQGILNLTDAGNNAEIHFEAGGLCMVDGQVRRAFVLTELPLDRHGYVLTAEATFDPPTTPLDENGQGVPYAVFGFGAHMVEIEVDTELGTVRVLKITAAHDVGRAINPTLIEGQIEGGAAQGLGHALMEEFFPGKGENLHDYLIPSAGDMPPVESMLIEDPTPIGPFGAKGIGEQAVIPTAPAILNAIHDAIGVRIHRIPATPDRVRAAIREARRTGEQRA